MPEIIRPAGMGDTPPASSNPLNSISAGYEQLQGIINSIFEMAKGTPWYVWAGIAVVLILKQKGDRE